MALWRYFTLPFRIFIVVALILVLLLFSVAAAAETSSGQSSASARVNLQVVVPPVLRIMSDQVVGTERHLVIWTNMRNANIEGRSFAFAQPGEQRVRLPVLVLEGQNTISSP